MAQDSVEAKIKFKGVLDEIALKLINLLLLLLSLKLFTLTLKDDGLHCKANNTSLKSISR